MSRPAPVAMRPLPENSMLILLAAALASGDGCHKPVLKPIIRRQQIAAIDARYAVMHAEHDEYLKNRERDKARTKATLARIDETIKLLDVLIAEEAKKKAEAAKPRKDD